MIKQLLSYLWKNKAWWMAPPIIIFIIFGALLAFSSIAPISPFIYMLF